MRVQCQACRANFKAPDQYAGRRVKCPRCSAVIELPNIQRAELVSPLEPDPIADMLDEELAAGPAMPTAPATQPPPPPRRRRRPKRTRPSVAGRRLDGGTLTSIAYMLLIPGVVIFHILMFAKSDIPLFSLDFLLFLCVTVNSMAQVWYTVRIFQEPGGWICFLAHLIPIFNFFYSLFFLVTRWERMREPFLLSLACVGTIMVLMIIMVIFGLTEGLAEGSRSSRGDRKPVWVNSDGGLDLPPSCEWDRSMPSGPVRSPIRPNPVMTRRGPMFLRRVGGQSNERPLRSTVTSSVRPRSSAPWLVRLEVVPSDASESLGSALFGSEPIPIGTSRFVRERAYAPADVGRAVVLHRRRKPTNRSSSRRDASYDYWLTWHNLHSSELIERLNIPLGGRLMALSPNGDVALLQVDSDDYRLVGWSLGKAGKVFDWKPYGKKTDRSRRSRHGTAGSWMWAAFVDDEHLLTYGGSPNRELIFWRIAHCEAVYTKPFVCGTGGVLSPGGKYVAFFEDGLIRIRETKTGNVKGELAPPDHVASQSCTTVGKVPGAFSPDGKRFAATFACGSHGTHLLNWDLADGKLRTQIEIGRGAGRPWWCGSRYLLVRGGDEQGMETLLVDTDRHAVGWRFDVHGGEKIEHCLDGRPWIVYRLQNGKDAMSYLVPLPLLEKKLLARLNGRLPEGRRLVLGPDTKISLKLDSFTPPQDTVDATDLRTRVESHLRDRLRRGGVRIAAGEPVALVATCRSAGTGSAEFETSRTGSRMADQGLPERSFVVPLTASECSLAVVDGSGNVLWKVSAVAGSDVYGSSVQVPEEAQYDVVRYLREKGQAARTKALLKFFFKTPVPKLLHGQPHDNQGRLGLGGTTIDLAEIVEIPEGQDLTGLVDTDRPDQREPPRGVSYERSSRQYVHKIMIDLIAGRDTVLCTRLQWFPIAKRPSIGLRLATGVYVSDKKVQPAVNEVRDLRNLIGPIGEYLGKQLESRLIKGDFGYWPDRGDPRFRQVILLGAAKPGQLIAAARRQAIDVLVIANMTARTTGLNRKFSKTLRFRFVDVATGDTLWTSRALKSSRIAAGWRDGAMPVEFLAEEILRQVDENFSLRPMPKFSPTVVQGRLKTLAAIIAEAQSSGNVQNLLAVMIELRYYHAKELATVEDVVPLYDRILGAGKGRILVTGKKAERREALQDWLSTM